MRSKILAAAAFALCFASANVPALLAANYSGMVTVTRDARRKISSAVLEATARDGAGNPVTYNIVMDENGMAIAEQYENKDIKIDGALSGKDLKADTWEGIPDGASGSSGSSESYQEPEPEPEPEPSEDSGDSDDPDASEKDDNDDGDKDEEPKEEGSEDSDSDSDQNADSDSSSEDSDSESED
ncbi:MAG: hypothetical protein PHD82_01320 [Candidatus Riflebacteria bacterium]|nr:hypothetical protein [Candidatus Riflebacteria bacterium]